MQRPLPTELDRQDEAGGRGSVLPTADDLPIGSAFFETLLDNLYDGVYYVDRDQRFRFWNKGAERISGYTRAEVVGRLRRRQLLEFDDDEGRSTGLESSPGPLADSWRTGLPGSGRVSLRHRDGRRIAVDLHVMPIHDDQGEIVGAVEVFRDASAMVALESAYRQMRELSERDPLTGIANRRHLDVILAQQADLLGRTGIPFAVVLTDLDHFKQVNDTWGHPIGDQVLTEFARILEQNCRSTDVVGRYGGEEFLAILPGTTLDQAHGVAQRLRAVTVEIAPAAMVGRRITASFGVAEANLEEPPAGLLRRVDAALYRAKKQGRDRVVLAGPTEFGAGTAGSQGAPASSGALDRVG